jgi:hypothetical protein
VGNHDGVIIGWEVLTEDEAIDAAIDTYGKDPTKKRCLPLCLPQRTSRRNGLPDFPEHPAIGSVRCQIVGSISFYDRRP